MSVAVAISPRALVVSWVYKIRIHTPSPCSTQASDFPRWFRPGTEVLEPCLPWLRSTTAAIVLECQSTGGSVAPARGTKFYPPRSVKKRISCDRVFVENPCQVVVVASFTFPRSGHVLDESWLVWISQWQFHFLCERGPPGAVGDTVVY